MKPRECVGCGRPVLEFRGQFAFLDSFYVDDDGPLLDSSGAWHARCLLESPYGPGWFACKWRNLVSVRRYEELATLPDWTVLWNRNRKEAIALSRTGMTLPLTFSRRPSRRVSEGIVCEVAEEYNLELDDRGAIMKVQEALSETGSFPLSSLFEMVGIADRVVHSEAFEGLLQLARDMPGEWDQTFVCGRAEYGVFVPAALEPFVSRTR